MKKLWILFIVLAVILSDVMCAVVAYSYCDLVWGGKYAGYSAPPSTAFAFAIPFLIAIAVCLAVAYVLRKRGK
ncbi:MAG: hypothetical protein IKO45_00670 [Clostridia bacterium]|nr:hypothetical protein [Clostridia bacterium]MBR4623052.1 hypothetical protein [Clostridia bacterium]MBR6823014.1 hypothetical protein [Clostridia bacterium]